jgi:hypothetical protein
MEKRFVGAAELLADSFRLARRIFESGFRPELLLGVWRGGTPVAIAVHEYLARRGFNCEHLPIKSASYRAPDQRDGSVRVAGIETVVAALGRGTSLLIVDDVFDTGLSLKELRRCLQDGAPPHALREIRTACPWYKPSRNRSGMVPDYYLHETDAWLVFPHELAGLSSAELRQKPDLAALVDDLALD